MRSTEVCRSCRAPIRWARHSVTGRRMPIDPEPVASGNVFVVGWEHDEGGVELPTPVVAVGHRSTALTDYAYVSHFATCPNASNHRRRKR